jgi:Fe-S cluster biogenesis protein NfuA
MSTQSEVYVSLEFTPNPNTLKYSVNRKIVEKGTVNFTEVNDAETRSPLAFKLLSVPGICGVMLGKDFITVTKIEEGDWDVVHKRSSQIIHDHLSSAEAILSDAAIESEGSKDGHKGGQTEIELKIKEILDQEIRPAVAMDGGDITFEKYEDGVVYVYLQGACSGCPSSTATLKGGIETRLRQAIPEINEVVAI